MNSANINDFGMDSRSMAGSLEVRLQAMRQVGFSQVMLCAEDLVNHPGGVNAAVAAVKHSKLRVTAFHAPIDFEGLTGALHTHKLDVAKTMLSLCHTLRCTLLVLPASTLAAADSQKLVADLRQLAMLAIPLRIKLALQGWRGAKQVTDYLQAWDLVCEAEMPNLGLCLDCHEVLASRTPPEDLQADLDMLDPDRLFLVQLADLLETPTQAMRVFPGLGAHRDELVAIVGAVHALGYRGDYCLVAQHADLVHMPQTHLAMQAIEAARWLGEDVLKRSVPLPNQIRLRRKAA
jgi:sugar phosphate isomerase/epimerase